MTDLFTFCDDLRKFRNGAANREVNVAMAYVDTEGRVLVYSGLVTSDRNFMGRPDEILFATKGELVLGPQLSEPSALPIPSPFASTGPRERNLEAIFNFVPKANRPTDGVLKDARHDPPEFEMKMVDFRLEGNLLEARAGDVADSRFLINFRKHIKASVVDLERSRACRWGRESTPNG